MLPPTTATTNSLQSSEPVPTTTMITNSMGTQFSGSTFTQASLTTPAGGSGGVVTGGGSGGSGTGSGSGGSGTGSGSGSGGSGGSYGGNTNPDGSGINGNNPGSGLTPGTERSWTNRTTNGTGGGNGGSFGVSYWPPYGLVWSGGGGAGAGGGGLPPWWAYSTGHIFNTSVQYSPTGVPWFINQPLPANYPLSFRHFPPLPPPHPIFRRFPLRRVPWFAKPPPPYPVRFPPSSPHNTPVFPRPYPPIAPYHRHVHLFQPPHFYAYSGNKKADEDGEGRTSKDSSTTNHYRPYSNTWYYYNNSYNNNSRQYPDSDEIAITFPDANFRSRSLIGEYVNEEMAEEEDNKGYHKRRNSEKEQQEHYNKINYIYNSRSNEYFRRYKIFTNAVDMFSDIFMGKIPWILMTRYSSSDDTSAAVKHVSNISGKRKKRGKRSAQTRATNYGIKKTVCEDSIITIT